MVVKEKRGRRRYIAFQVDGKASDEEFLAALNAALSSRGVKVPKVIQFDGRMGVVRCSPKDKDRILAALAADGKGIVPLSTSGTLLTLRKRYFSGLERRD
ncbi:MAG TPA: hypothetical protein P5063_04365 [Methanomassiliicoccales archaeon]|nr:hypothetical protein [Methanomassiliicoccales archaeon]